MRRISTGVFVGVFLFLVLLIQGYQAPEEDWIAIYHNIGEDRPQAIAVDSSGNVYVTGCSAGYPTRTDYATVKYDTNGNELWAKRYVGIKNDGMESVDRAYDIAVDSSGNVYVTGYLWQPGVFVKYGTVKYDTNGNELWDATIDNGKASAIAVDTSGNVYVTGASNGDYTTVKYDTDGNELWIVRYDSGGGGSDSASDIVVDSYGNVYVTGALGVEGSTLHGFATVAYDSDGIELWAAKYEDPIGWASEMAVDSSGNVYVTGISGGNKNTVIKYDNLGNELWVATYGGPRANYNWTTDIAIDSSGNVYVTGASGYYNVEDYATAKFDSSGNRLWTATYGTNGKDRATDIAIDSSGNVYVTGYQVWHAAGGSCATVAYDRLGSELWVAVHSCERGCNANALAIDSSGNVYVTGQCLRDSWDYTTFKYITYITVQIDIKPGSDPNSINLGSKGNVPVAIFSTADFDATTVDPLTVTLAGAEVRIKGKGDSSRFFEDVNGDGLLDLLVHVDTQTFVLTSEDTEAVLEGQTFDRRKIRGVDYVRIVQ